MKKIFGILVGLVFIATIALAEVTIPGAGRVEEIQGGKGIAITRAGQVATVAVTGVVPAAVYTTNSGATAVHLTKIGADGTIYGGLTSAVLIDTGLYSAAAGTGGVRYLRITADGTIYGSAT